MSGIPPQPFVPHRLVRNRHVQSILASSGLRRLRLRSNGPVGVEEYFAGCTLTGDVLAPLEVATTILTSRDDPVIGFEEFRRLPQVPALRLEAHDHGGHCAYIEGPSLRSWLDRRIVELLSPISPSR